MTRVQMVIGSLFFSFITGHSLFAQTVSLIDGSTLPTQYCREDKAFSLTGTPTGGTFSGCGVFEENGQWYFNPVVATAGATVFPISCSMTYTIADSSVTVPLLIWKPVVITPALQDTFTCNGYFYLHATTLYAGAYDYAWTPSQPLDLPDSPNTPGFITSTQTFVLTAVDHISGCMGSDSITIERYPEPELIVSHDTTINARGSVQLYASGAQTYLWLPNRWLDQDTVASPVAQPQLPIIYQVIGINEYGCRDTADIRVDIREQLFLPNAFSPNGDGVNDVFGLGNYGYQGVNAFMIFNRWGEKVFQTIDGTQGWDGTYKGRPAATGTYYYDVRLVLPDGTERAFRGALALIR